MQVFKKSGIIFPKIGETDYYMEFWQFLLQGSALLEWSDSRDQVMGLRVTACHEF